MAYRVDLSDRAHRRLARIDRRTAERIRDAIAALASDPRTPGSILLSGIVPRTYRIRIGDYRVLYLIEDDAETVYVLEVGHRRDIYRPGLPLGPSAPSCDH